MAKGNVKKKQQQHTDSKAAAYVAGFFLLLGLLTGAALFMDAEGGIMAFVAKCELYLLGKGSFVLPLACFLLSWKLFVEGKLALWQKKTLAIFLVMLCLLGTAHHVFVPMAKELTPHLLLEGGGLLGALIVLPLHRFLGGIGSLLALGLGWLCALGMLLPVGIIADWLKDLVADITGKSDEELEKALQQEEEPVQKGTKNIFKPISFGKPQQAEGAASKAKPAKGNSIEKAYRSGEFGSFTDGIEKKSSFKRILGGGDNPYDQEQVKQELERDPIQLPEWQETPREFDRERNIVLRPVINYDTAQGPVTTPETVNT
ncbi:MAG: DNA translocase FtsK 4TM domain-containing protein, partial [Phascolarctobacterium sp.]|nr:DNA translocase FtsK 4TM domain-containing protein [Phascolarctobacterium sp.]